VIQGEKNNNMRCQAGIWSSGFFGIYIGVRQSIEKQNSKSFLCDLCGEITVRDLDLFRGGG
jgi:hypothetical protein